MLIQGHTENAMYLHIGCFSLLRQKLHIIKWRYRRDMKIASVNFKVWLSMSTDNMFMIHNGDIPGVTSASAART